MNTFRGSRPPDSKERTWASPSSLGIGSLIGGKFGGYLMHHYGEVKHEPSGVVTVIVAVGVVTAILLLVYDRLVLGKAASHEAQV